MPVADTCFYLKLEFPGVSVRKVELSSILPAFPSKGCDVPDVPQASKATFRCKPPGFQIK